MYLTSGRGLMEGVIRALRLVLAVVAVTGILVAGVALRQRSEAEAVVAARCAGWKADSIARSRIVATAAAPRTRVVVIGDSYSRGYGLPDPSRSWPSYLAEPLAAKVFVDGFDGSGFTDSNRCAVPYSSRVAAALARRPDMVLVEGGLNDAYRTDAQLRAGVAELVHQMGRVHGVRLVVIGPPDSPVITDAARVDSTLAALSVELGFEYVSTYGWDLPLASDGVHPTMSGHRIFARLLIAQMEPA